MPYIPGAEDVVRSFGYCLISTVPHLCRFQSTFTEDPEVK
jgi:hypothetical protein